MDDLIVYRDDFDTCFSNLKAILKRCIKKILVLN